MSVCHYLFWQENNRISAIHNKGNSFEFLKIGGNVSISYTETYWELWQEYAGFLKGDFIDFCFVFDNECPQISEYLKERECLDSECVWNKYAIQSVADMMDITNATQIYNKEGHNIAKAGFFRGVQETDINRLMAFYRNSTEIIQQEEEKTVEMTPFIKDMIMKLKSYDEQ